MKLRGLFSRKLRRDASGVAATELALGLPFLLFAGLWGIELANYAVITMRVNQLAVHTADNASRIGDISSLENRRIYEGDINDLLQGADIQGGNSIDFFDHGRAIVSSLEMDEDGDQYIHWQRCLGAKDWDSSYGVASERLPDGIGPEGRKVLTFEGEAVIFVELAYDYQPLISARFVGTPQINSISSFIVRSDRDLSQIYQRDPDAPDPIAACDVHDNPLGAIPNI